MQICQVSYARPSPEAASFYFGSGKLQGRPLFAAAGTPFPTPSSVSKISSSSISIFERHSNRHFLVDSGADESVFPASVTDRSGTRSSNLVAANGTTIFTYGCRMLPISCRPGHMTQHEFWIADISRPILGASFFHQQGLLIDLQHRRLVDLSLIHI